MICPNCGREDDFQLLFCHNCGAALSENADAPSAPVDAQPESHEPEAASPCPELDENPVEPEATPAASPITPLYDTTSFAYTTPVSQPVAPTPAPATPRGRHWPPIVIMAVLTLLGLLFFFLLPGEPALTTYSEDGCFSVTNGALMFHKENYTGGESLTVPASVGGQAVVSLKNNCFQSCDAFTEIVLPDSLTSIGMSAFAGCTSLRGIFIPDQVTFIGILAFEGCTSLEAICIPESVRDMGTGVFSGCEKLRHVFYFGQISQWQLLYPEYINDQVTIYTDDGAYVGSN